MRPNLFLIPGFGDDCIGEGYTPIKEAFINKFNVIYSNITWNHKYLPDWQKEFSCNYLNHKQSNNTVVGFSYGSLTALTTAPSLQPKNIILCSLSPCFAEDVAIFPKSFLKQESKCRIESFKKEKFSELIKNLMSKEINFHLIVGEKELIKWPIMKARFEECIKYLHPKSMTIVPKAKHKLDQNYSQYLIDVIKKL